MFQIWPLVAGGEVDGDDVEADCYVFQVMLPQVSDGGSGETQLLFLVDGLDRRTGSQVFPCFHFNEDHRSTVDRDQVDFGVTRLVVAGEDLITSLQQPAFGE